MDFLVTMKSVKSDWIRNPLGPTHGKKVMWHLTCTGQWRRPTLYRMVLPTKFFSLFVAGVRAGLVMMMRGP